LAFEASIGQTEFGAFLSQFCNFGILRRDERGTKRRQETDGLLDGEHDLLEHVMNGRRIHGCWAKNVDGENEVQELI
jgi:hypothetical protein